MLIMIMGSNPDWATTSIYYIVWLFPGNKNCPKLSSLLFSSTRSLFQTECSLRTLQSSVVVQPLSIPKSEGEKKQRDGPDVDRTRKTKTESEEHLLSQWCFPKQDVTREENKMMNKMFEYIGWVYVFCHIMHVYKKGQKNVSIKWIFKWFF